MNRCFWKSLSWNQSRGTAAAARANTPMMYCHLMPAMNSMAKAMNRKTSAEPSSPEMATRMNGMSACNTSNATLRTRFSSSRTASRWTAKVVTKKILTSSDGWKRKNPRLIQVRASVRLEGASPNSKTMIISMMPNAPHMYQLFAKMSISMSEMTKAMIRPMRTATIMAMESRGRRAPSFMVCQVALVTISTPADDARRQRKRRSLSVPFQK